MMVFTAARRTAVAPALENGHMLERVFFFFFFSLFSFLSPSLLFLGGKGKQ
jgi:hypothetical protein